MPPVSRAAPAPPSARKHYLWSTLLAKRAVIEAQKARSRPSVLATVVATHQIVAATMAPTAVAQMLAEQQINESAQGLLVTAAFTTSPDAFLARVDRVGTDLEFERLVGSLVQDAARTAESVAVAVTPQIGFVRYLSLPACGRCAVLAGRTYRYDAGFLRHPNCGCVMLPTGVGNEQLARDPAELLRAGQIADVPKRQEGPAGFISTATARLRNGGVRDSGLSLSRAGRPAPAAIYRATKSREDAVNALAAAGYVRP